METVPRAVTNANNTQVTRFSVKLGRHNHLSQEEFILVTDVYTSKLKFSTAIVCI